MPGFFIPIQGVAPGVQGPGHTDEIARKYRWTIRLSIPQIDPVTNNFVDLKAFSCDRPKTEIKEMVIHNGADEIYRPGKISYSPINIKYYEGVSSNNLDITASRFYRWWALNVYDQRTSLYGIFKQVAATCEISMLDGKGGLIWKYLLYNCWPSKLEPDTLEYGSNDFAKYSLTLRYDKYIEVTE